MKVPTKTEIHRGACVFLKEDVACCSLIFRYCCVYFSINSLDVQCEFTQYNKQLKISLTYVQSRFKYILLALLMIEVLSSSRTTSNTGILLPPPRCLRGHVGVFCASPSIRPADSRVWRPLF